MFTTQQRDYIFKALDDKTREQEVFKSARPRFREIINLVLNQYGLAERLRQAKSMGDKVCMLDLGCSEGLYLHELANILEEQGLLEGASLNGIDRSQAAIGTAQEFALRSKPPRPYLSFYLQDATKPFNENLGMRYNKATQFDFIYSIVTLMYIADAPHNLAKIYNDDLKPGGVIYLRDLTTADGPFQIISPHPTLSPLVEFYKAFVNSLNQENSTALDAGKWLRELGAEKMQTLEHTLEASSHSPEELAMLRNILLMTRGIAHQMISQNLMTEADFNKLIATVYKEIDRDSRGQVTYFDTVGQKPA